MTKNCTVSLLYVLGIGKISILLFQKERLYRLINIVLATEQSVCDHGSPVLIKIFDKYCYQSRWVTNIPHTELFLSGPSYVKYPNGTATNIIRKPFVFSSWFPFNDNETPGYEIAFIIHIISGNVGGWTSAIANTHNYAMMVFAAGQLKILQNKLENLGNLRVWFNPVMFLELLVCSIMLCAILYQVTIQDFNVRLFFTVEYLIAMIIVLFISYWHANEVLVESLKVADSVGISSWYTFDNKSKHLLRLILMRSQKPLVLTAGPFHKMSLETFLDILKASFTYLTLLRIVYEEE
ncbi:odorant receptor Or2-like [Chrysoperla carnea]|uniref:odorant receptor Or2-like n=1 Tax=Chrysoperla carnea TaxID=189513 RepID=UPI001D0848C8|nr:odorant receptor Or2-like [Chrysoperla carnea]